VATLERRAERGKPTPALERRPAVRDDLVDVWSAFIFLHGRRQAGMGPQPIGLTEIDTYLGMMRIGEPSERRLYVRLICALDQTYLRRMADRSRT